jgi:hypothetical protein
LLRVTRACACGCGVLFKAKNSSHRFLNPSHRPPADRSKWDSPMFRRQRRVAGFAVRRCGVDCGRCGFEIAPDAPWQLDHLPDGSLHPAHRRCNARAGPDKVRQIAGAFLADGESVRAPLEPRVVAVWFGREDGGGPEGRWNAFRDSGESENRPISTSSVEPLGSGASHTADR